MLVSEADVAEIVRLGTLRAPREACGLLLTRSDGGLRVVEVENKASEVDLCRMDPADLDEALTRLREGFDGDVAKALLVWHTHPRGNVGPSKTDMTSRKTLGGIRCLVVSLPNGEAVQF